MLEKYNMVDPKCPFQLTDQIGPTFECDLSPGHEGQHICYCEDGTSCDNSQPEPDEDDPEAEYETETVKYSVRWPDAP